MKQNQQYEIARLVVEVLLSDDDKQKSLARHGFDRKRAQDGQAILNKIDQLTDEYQQQDGAKLQSSKTLQSSREEAHELYMRHVRLARLVFGDSIEQQRPLKIDVPRQRSLAGWLEQATTFYRNAPAFIADLSKVGITIEEIQQGDAMVQAVAKARVKQAQGASAVQRLSKQRTAAFQDLSTWLKDFRYIARYTFQNDPQQLEAFGMVVA